MECWHFLAQKGKIPIGYYRLKAKTMQFLGEMANFCSPPFFGLWS